VSALTLPGLSIRAARPEDWPGLWAALEPVIRAGESSPLDRDLDEAQARAYWCAPDKTASSLPVSARWAEAAPVMDKPPPERAAKSRSARRQPLGV
jgi:hypothetical protein